ncbi:Membrane transport protein [Roseovarius albus]|uniref:Membrane transport protein n=1 Tax=Roseovarius albus TaxID=1247867 RepID=A0A1X6ZAF4_9RHOB|nr:AEC family transporter [Roseovarius albus]SLN45304.1 Membrane transport protein [Roseovarius albus]
MQALLNVILPVFIVLGFGYLAVWRNWFSQAGVDGVMVFTQKFAIPCLLFNAMANLDLGQSFEWRLLSSFYIGALSGFALGVWGARYLFSRDWQDAIAIGFCCLFSNSLLLGLPITERAYGSGALTANFAIIALHSPFCYGVGITAMEIAKARESGGRASFFKVLKAMFSNAMIVGITLGLIVNLLNVELPEPLGEAIALIARAALPAALFGLGGILVQYRPQGDLRVALYVCVISLTIHPMITFALSFATGISVEATRSAVITAAMAPGVNAYIFANMYGRGQRVAASAVLIATGISIVTAWIWLTVLP